MVKNLPVHAGEAGLDPWYRKIPHAEEQLNPYTTTTEPQLRSPSSALHCDYRRPHALEPKLHKRSPHAATREWQLTAARESPHSHEDTAQPKTNIALWNKKEEKRISGENNCLNITVNRYWPDLPKLLNFGLCNSRKINTERNKAWI